MKLNITYDTNTLNTAPSAFFGAVNYVASLFNVTFNNNVTVNIEIGYGTFPLDSSTVPALSESQENGIVVASYSQLRQALINQGAPGASTLSLSSPLSGNLEIGSAQQKALGVLGPSGALDGWIGVASDATLSRQLGASWSYSPTAVPSSSQFYLVGALEHEISEVMGRLSYLNVQGEYGIMDLYRYRAAGVRQTGIGSPAYFSIDRGNTNLDNWNTLSGGDLGDWAASAGADAFLAFNPAGQINGLTSADITLMQALGYGAAATTGPSSPTSPPPSSAVPFDRSWNVVGVGDFDGNGKADLAWQRSTDNLVEVQLFNGTTPSGGGVIGNSPFDASWRVVASGDFNGDGRMDLVYRRLSDGYTEIQLLDGVQGIGGGAISNNPFDKTWQVVAAGDFNGDGNADLAWRQTSSGLLEVQFLWGANALGGGVVANNPFDLSWNIVGTGDFNADGNADLVWRHNPDGLVEIQFLNGNNAAGGGAIANNPFDASWSVVATGDFLGNGHSDLVWQRASDGLVEIQFLDGDVAVGGGVVQNNPFGAGWQVVGAADFNGDGKSDLVYRRISDGATAVQLLSGTSIIGGIAPSSDLPSAGQPEPGNGNGTVADGDYFDANGVQHGFRAETMQPANGNPDFDNGWNITGTGQTTGDGLSDLIWQNKNSPPLLSADGSILTAGSAGNLVTGDGTWTFDAAATPYGNLILLNGQSAVNGSAVELEVANQGHLYADNSQGQWWQWNGSGWAALSDPSSSPPLPSADGSILTAGSAGDLMTDDRTWTFDTVTTPYADLLLLNGQSAANGSAVELEVANQGHLYADNSQGQWWQWNGSGWAASSDPTLLR